MRAPVLRDGGTRRRRLASRLVDRTSGDAGFFLLETVLALTLITVIMSAVGVEYVTELAATSHERATAGAVQLADSTLERLHAMHPSDLVSGRDQSSTSAEFQTLSAIPAVAPWVSTSTMTPVWDTAAAPGAGSSAPIPTSAVMRRPDAIAYQVYQYLGTCYAAVNSGTCTAGPAAISYLRAVVAIVWTQRGCPNSVCSYATATLISTADDPPFDINQPLPKAPVIVSPGDQTTAVGDTVSLQLTVQDNTGVTPFTWAVTAGSLPPGVALSPTGLLSGTVTGSSSVYTTKIQVTDAFLRTATTTINWTVNPHIAITDPGSQVSTVNEPDTLQVATTGGSGTPVYSASGLPAGLSISASGLISGKPTRLETATVVITATSGGGGTTSDTITWTVVAGPAVSMANSYTTTATATVSVAVNYTCNNPTCTLALSGAPNGVTLSRTTVPAGSGMVHIAGTVSASAANGNAPQVYSLAVTCTDSATATATTTSSWTVNPAPVANLPNAVEFSPSKTGTQPVAVSYGTGPYTYRLQGAPGWLSVSSSGVISGTAPATRSHVGTVTVVVTDSAGVSASAATDFYVDDLAWVSGGVPDQTTSHNNTASVNTASYAAGGSGTKSYFFSYTASWLSSSGSTVTAARTSRATSAIVTVTVTDAIGYTITDAFNWTRT